MQHLTFKISRKSQDLIVSQLTKKSIYFGPSQWLNWGEGREWEWSDTGIGGREGEGRDEGVGWHKDGRSKGTRDHFNMTFFISTTDLFSHFLTFEECTS